MTWYHLIYFLITWSESWQVPFKYQNFFNVMSCRPVRGGGVIPGSDCSNMLLSFKLYVHKISPKPHLIQLNIYTSNLQHMPFLEYNL